jgi:hypothetical protein
MSPFYVAVFRLFNLLFLGVSFLPTPLRLFLPCFADLLLACFADLSYFSIPLLLFHFTLLALFLPRVARFVGNTGIKTDLFKLKPKTQRKRKETQHQYYSKTRLRMKIQVVPELARQPLTANFNI